MALSLIIWPVAGKSSKAKPQDDKDAEMGKTDTKLRVEDCSVQDGAA